MDREGWCYTNARRKTSWNTVLTCILLRKNFWNSVLDIPPEKYSYEYG
jgi:hypothetical protein